jgi:hypothetical protein
MNKILNVDDLREAVNRTVTQYTNINSDERFGNFLPWQLDGEDVQA